MDYAIIALTAIFASILAIMWHRLVSQRRQMDEQRGALEWQTRTLEQQARILAKEREEALQMVEAQRATQEELNELTKQNYILHEINRAINATVDEQEIVSIILQAMVTLTGAESASIMLREGEDVRVLTHCGLENPSCELEQLSCEIGDTVAWRVMTTGQAFVHKERSVYQTFGASMCNYVASVPLTFVKEVIGCLNIHSMGPKYEMTNSKVEVLQILADQAALALKNSSMYHQLKRQNEYFARQAVTDGLTGLHNHRYFQQRLKELLEEADRHNGRIALLLFDIDHFKRFNDTYGHPFGDEVLRQIAQILLSVIGTEDIAARYGGEEFAVILPNADMAGAAERAENIRKAIEDHIFSSVDGSLVTKVTVSIGVADWMKGTDESQLIEAADQALYKAKRQGRNRICLAERDSKQAEAAS